jgi:PQQ-dependent dehydrogenase (s-GDH family)
MNSRVAAASVILAASTAVALVHAQNPRERHNPGPERFASRVVATGLSNPWEVTWGPDGYLWVTERTAFRVTRVNPADGSRHVALTIEDAYQAVVQDGLLGLALHPDLLRGRGRDYVYLAYTYDAGPGPSLNRRLRVRRYTFDQARQTLTEPHDLLDNLPAHDDHGGGRLIFGPDGMLYLSRGDHGANFLANYCLPNRALDLPKAAEIQARDWSTYQGKMLRLTPDGAIPPDNPLLDGVRSHIYTYGHRNIQGMAFAPDGRLYASEHGPSTDDEINLLAAGKNYGWPQVAGFRDDQSYAYANWSASAPEPCRSLKFDVLAPPPSVPQMKESAWQHPDFVEPIATLFTVPADYDFRRFRNATIAPGGLDVYTAAAIPDWNRSLLVIGMRAGAVYRLKLSADGSAVLGGPIEYFRALDRYRDLAFSPDGQRVFLVTDNFGTVVDGDGKFTSALEHPGALIEFTFVPDSRARQ